MPNLHEKSPRPRASRRENLGEYVLHNGHTRLRMNSSYYKYQHPGQALTQSSRKEKKNARNINV